MELCTPRAGLAVLGRPRTARQARRHVSAEAQRTAVAAVATCFELGPQLRVAVATLGLTAGLCICGLPRAEALKIPPEPLEDVATRCKISTLDKFADTRAKFSLEASSGAMDEALVDIRGCDFHGEDLSAKVFSGVLMDGANLEGSTLVGVEMSRAIARDAKLAGIDLTDANAFATVFDGSDLRGAQFENAILSSASFGKGAGGNWANLEDAHFEGALLSSSDISRVCANPTISPLAKAEDQHWIAGPSSTPDRMFASMSSDAAEKFPSHEFDAEEVDGAELSIRVMWHE